MRDTLFPTDHCVSCLIVHCFVKLEVTGCVVSWSRAFGVYTDVFLLALVHVVDQRHLRERERYIFIYF